MNMTNAIITGATGSIGIALIETLIRNQVSVIAVVRPDSEKISRIPQSEYVDILECSLDNLHELPEKINQKIDVFFHLGWDGTFGNSRNNMHGQNLNIRYTIDAVEAAEKLGCEAFVGAGSQAEYGRVEGKLSGVTPVNPENGYGAAKLCAGQMSRIMCRERGIRHMWARILSIYGPYDTPGTMVMSTIDKLMNGEVPKFTKAEQKWDYLYSMDAGKALYLMGLHGKTGKVYCIGSGRERTLREYIELIRNEINSEAELGFGDVPYALNQVMYLCADIDELKNDTGFEPEYSFEQGIKNTVSWYRENQMTMSREEK